MTESDFAFWIIATIAILGIVYSSLHLFSKLTRYYRRMSVREFDDFVDLLSKIVCQSRQLLESFEAPSPSPKLNELFTLMALTGIVRNSESVKAMAQAGAYGGIDVVARSAFETYADLLNLLKHKEQYPRYMVWASYNQQRTLLGPVTSGGVSRYKEPFEKAAKSRGQGADELLAVTRNSMEEIEQSLPDSFKDRKGKVKTGDKFKFELAEKVDEYDALYRHLSYAAHGRVVNLGQGIVQDDGSIRWPPGGLSQPLLIIDSVCAILLESCALVAREFNKADAPFKKLAAEHKSIRREASQERKRVEENTK